MMYTSQYAIHEDVIALITTLWFCTGGRQFQIHFEAYKLGSINQYRQYLLL